MAFYRICWVGSRGGGGGPTLEIDCPDDNTAVRHARDLSNGRLVEVWLREEFVAFVNDGGELAAVEA